MHNLGGLRSLGRFQMSLSSLLHGVRTGQRFEELASDAALPTLVFCPMLIPPWNLHRPLVHKNSSEPCLVQTPPMRTHALELRQIWGRRVSGVRQPDRATLDAAMLLHVERRGRPGCRGHASRRGYSRAERLGLVRREVCTARLASRGTGTPSPIEFGLGNAARSVGWLVPCGCSLFFR